MNLATGRATNHALTAIYATDSASGPMQRRNWWRSYARPSFPPSSRLTAIYATPAISNPGLASWWLIGGRSLQRAARHKPQPPTSLPKPGCGLPSTSSFGYRHRVGGSYSRVPAYNARIAKSVRPPHSERRGSKEADRLNNPRAQGRRKEKRSQAGRASGRLAVH
jgi:hypothetical protein